MEVGLARSSPATAALALVGFTFATLRSSSARASGTDSASSSTSDGTADGTNSAIVGTVVATAITAVVTVVVVVVVIVVVVKRRDDPGTRTRALLDGGLLTQRGDLGLQLGLCIESPAAWDQLDDELAAGGGPAAEGLARATGLPVPVLAARWQATSERAGPITSRAAATRFAAELGIALAPDLAVPREVAADVVWQLHRERVTPTTAAEGPTHAWIGRWLGVPPATVAAASEEALAPLRGLTDAEARARVDADPDAILNALAARVERTELAAVDARLAALAEQASPWLSGELGAQASLLVAGGG